MLHHSKWLAANTQPLMTARPGQRHALHERGEEHAAEQQLFGDGREHRDRDDIERERERAAMMFEDRDDGLRMRAEESLLDRLNEQRRPAAGRHQRRCRWRWCAPVVGWPKPRFCGFAPMMLRHSVSASTTTEPLLQSCSTKRFVGLNNRARPAGDLRNSARPSMAAGLPLRMMSTASNWVTIMADARR